jgi:hypothetical protein
MLPGDYENETEAESAEMGDLAIAHEVIRNLIVEAEVAIRWGKGRGVNFPGLEVAILAGNAVQEGGGNDRPSSDRAVR